MVIIENVKTTLVRFLGVASSSQVVESEAHLGCAVGHCEASHFAADLEVGLGDELHVVVGLLASRVEVAELVVVEDLLGHVVLGLLDLEGGVVVALVLLELLDLEEGALQPRVVAYHEDVGGDVVLQETDEVDLLVLHSCCSPSSLSLCLRCKP